MASSPLGRPTRGTWEHPAGWALQDVNGRQYTSVVGYRTGWGATYKGTGDGNQRDTWFHIPVPTLTIMNDRSVFLDQFHILFTSSSTTGISDVHAWDANRRIAAFRAVLRSDGSPYSGTDIIMEGDWSTLRQLGPTGTFLNTILRNTFSPRNADGSRIRIVFGLNICMLVQFKPDGDICFHGAGANWSDQPR